MLAALLLLALLFLVLGVFTTLKWLLVIAAVFILVAVIRGAMARSGGGY